jgi:hypothetical protein
MMNSADDLQGLLQSLHAEALRVGDSPLRADHLAAKLPSVMRASEYASLPEDVQHRIGGVVASAERVLRREDDGREAARHIQSALALLKPRPRKPSPFLDDLEE